MTDFHFHAAQRLRQPARNICGEAASCCCGSALGEQLGLDTNMRPQKINHIRCSNYFLLQNRHRSYPPALDLKRVGYQDRNAEKSCLTYQQFLQRYHSGPGEIASTKGKRAYSIAIEVLIVEPDVGTFPWANDGNQYCLNRVLQVAVDVSVGVSLLIKELGGAF